MNCFLHDRLLCTLGFPFLKGLFSHTIIFQVLIIYRALKGFLTCKQYDMGNVGEYLSEDRCHAAAVSVKSWYEVYD